MADDDIDIEGEFNFKIEVGDGLYDTNELPSKSANLLPEFTNPPWMLEQGWSLDNCVDEKSKATIEKMLLEEQQYINGQKKGKYLGINKSLLLVKTSSQASPEAPVKRQWTDEEKKLFLKGLELYGRSWSKIATLIPSRTTMQVKNYAQQYLKTITKKTCQLKPETVLRNGTQTSYITATVTSSTDAAHPIVATVASITTAKPTITTLPRNHLMTGSSIKHRSPKLTEAKDKHSPWRDGFLPVKHVNLSSSLKIISNSIQAPTIDAINKPDPASDRRVSSTVDVKDEKEIASLSETNMRLATNASDENRAKMPIKENENNASGSESEVDIDIENDDDENDNLILQSRSASPSSVYSKLLQQAKVELEMSEDAVQLEEQSDGKDKCENSRLSDEESSFDDDLKSNNADDSGDGVIQGSDTALSSDSMRWDTAGNDIDAEDGDYGEEVTETPFTKQYVNGVISASGEVHEFPIPIEEKIINRDSIIEEEKMLHSEFFDGRPLKTPERYMKIRNYILDCWKKSKPSYLNKTSVRPGLKNCGDVNCIGRIHAYLESVGAINFGCEQAAYNNPSRVFSAVGRSKSAGREQPVVISMSKLEAMVRLSGCGNEWAANRPRKRRIRDSDGIWVDKKELEGKTIEHKPEKDGQGKAKNGRGSKSVYDPFKLVPCQLFTEGNKEPFRVEVLSTALAVMDIHAHISRTEVIGMLGGQYCTQSSLLTISMAVPCKSISTGMQCEMDPVSETLASEQIEDVGMQVVGWYHSHPTFAPNPSVRDIETQQKFQHWFAKGGNHFVGIIISPYSPHNASVISDIRCLTIGHDIAQEFLCYTPYQFVYNVAYRDNLREILGPASELAEKYSTYPSRVALSCIYKTSLGITCLSKMLQSVKHRLEPPEPEQLNPCSRRKVDDVLHWLEQIFIEKFSTTAVPSLELKEVPTIAPPMVSDIPPGDYEVHI